jgi:hypothetical protein
MRAGTSRERGDGRHHLAAPFRGDRSALATGIRASDWRDPVWDSGLSAIELREGARLTARGADAIGDWQTATWRSQGYSNAARRRPKVLNVPLAHELLRSNIPARLAYTGRDGAPRAIPIAFHWTGTEFVVCTPPHAAKVPALRANPQVALTIDTTTFPPHVLLVRGTDRVDAVDGVPPEYLTGSKKIVGEAQFPAFETQVRSLYQQMARITIVPEWAKLLDFETRIPTTVAQLVNR